MGVQPRAASGAGVEGAERRERPDRRIGISGWTDAFEVGEDLVRMPSSMLRRHSDRGGWAVWVGGRISGTQVFVFGARIDSSTIASPGLEPRFENWGGRLWKILGCVLPQHLLRLFVERRRVVLEEFRSRRRLLGRPTPEAQVGMPAKPNRSLLQARRNSASEVSERRRVGSRAGVLGAEVHVSNRREALGVAGDGLVPEGERERRDG